MEAENMQIIRDAYDAYRRGDIPHILNILTEDVEWVEPGPTEIPWAGTWNGPAEVARFFDMLDQNTEVQQFDPREFLASNDMVGVFGYWRGRSKKTNKTFESDWAMFFRMRNGKIARFQSYVDTAAEAAAHSRSAAA